MKEAQPCFDFQFICCAEFQDCSCEQFKHQAGACTYVQARYNAPGHHDGGILQTCHPIVYTAYPRWFRNAGLPVNGSLQLRRGREQDKAQQQCLLTSFAQHCMHAVCYTHNITPRHNSFVCYRCARKAVWQDHTYWSRLP